MHEAIEGGCFCGRIRYRLKRRPMFVHCCHCTDCRRQLGSAFAINGLVETENVELLQGEPVLVTLSTDSGRPHDVYRCAECQSPLWSDYGRRKWLSFLRLATLDPPAEFTPDVHIYTRSKLDWLPLPPGARAFEAYYDVKAEWPKESLERLETARAKAKARA
ncbi:Gfa-like protein [Sinorhizobium sojae CCBAU 05684]|uniref:Gfa-like protein n=1 Tax=Sinorhizobium sojae CCBAU 05684 TaxID=716928 RepID=A0A249PGV0_9HYPH|nr:GFA family protein [Sinorhizobium sojae]ASY65016.1 Gfa-like protein [Sinorhizobium sojae CCBAU 05684]